MSQLGINWFDFVAVLFLTIGIFIGRRRGMSSEVADLLLWVLIIVVGAFTYKQVGGFIRQMSGLPPAAAAVSAYLFVAAALTGAFMFLRHIGGDKWFGTDAFGQGEYYVGMAAGGLRFLCILVFCLALFNAKQVSDVELQAQLKAQKENLGEIYFPPYGMIQRSVFSNSMSGRLVQEHLSPLLIQVPVSPDTAKGRETIYRRRQRDVEEIIK